MLNFFRVELFPCFANISNEHFSCVALMSYCTFFVLHYLCMWNFFCVSLFHVPFHVTYTICLLHFLRIPVSLFFAVSFTVKVYFVLHFFHIPLFLCCAFSVLHFLHIACFLSCIISIVQSFHVLIFSCLTFILLHSLMLHFLYYIIFMLHLHYFCGAPFSVLHYFSAAFLVLHSFQIKLSSYCTRSILHCNGEFFEKRSRKRRSDCVFFKCCVI